MNNKPQIRSVTCKYCGKPCKRNCRKFCSHKCYTDSGQRREAMKLNGAKAYRAYWEKFYEIFQRKYGHLDPITQTRLLVIAGMKRTYRRQHNLRVYRETANAKNKTNQIQDRCSSGA